METLKNNDQTGDQTVIETSQENPVEETQKEVIKQMLVPLNAIYMCGD